MGIKLKLKKNKMDTYYVKNEGNDNNSGLSNDLAWATINKVLSSKLAPGDKVLFKRGDIWKQVYISPSFDGVKGRPITFGAYGTGAKPKLFGSITINSGWTEVSTNIWQNTNAAFKIDVGNLVFNKEQSTGWKVSSESELTTQGRFYSDIANSRIRMYSTSNPGIFYNNIEACLKLNVINTNFKNFLTFKGLDIRYTGAHGIGGQDNSFINISECDISYCGGSYLKDKLRYGNGIEFYESSHDCKIEKNKISNCYDVALTSQGKNSGHQVYNMFFKNNVCWDNEWSFELYCRPEDAYCHDLYFENNVCMNAGGGWSHSQRTDPSGSHVMLINFKAKKDKIFIRNNIFFNWTNYAVRYTPLNFIKEILIDNNTYINDNGNIANVDGTLYNHATQFELYKKISGKDNKSVKLNKLVSKADIFNYFSKCKYSKELYNILNL